MPDLQLIARATAVHARLIALAAQSAYNPYDSAKPLYWIAHAERLSARIDAQLDALENL